MTSLRAELLTEKCGIAGVIAPYGSDAAPLVTVMGKSLEHRGQEGGGVGTKIHGGIFRYYREGESFNQIFNSEKVLARHGLNGEIALAHTRYRTLGPSNDLLYAQPILVGDNKRTLMGGHNGQVVNYLELADCLRSRGVRLETDNTSYPVSDSEVLFNWFLKAPGKNWIERIARGMEDVKGAVSAVLATDQDEMIALRDPYGIRPLSFGRINDHFAIASETSVLDKIGAVDQTEIKKGEIWVFRSGRTPENIVYDDSKLAKECNFERYYFAWPSSVLNGVPVDLMREAFGTQLAEEEIASGRLIRADLVTCLPDTGRSGAVPFAERLGIPYRDRAYKERYGGAGVRSFIGSSPLLRGQILDKKFSFSRSMKDPSIYVTDDSGVRFITWKYAVHALRERYGVKKIHLRSLAPKFVRPCYLGVNINKREELGAVEKRADGTFTIKSDRQIAEELGVESVAFLSINGYKKVMEGFGINPEGFCGYCHGEDGPDYDWKKYDLQKALEMYGKI